MEEVLDLYQSKPGKPARYDYDYERGGTANVFLSTEPLRGWRTVDVREQRTSVDWAHQIKSLLNEHYPTAEKVRLVCDNLNTSLPPPSARRGTVGLPSP